MAGLFNTLDTAKAISYANQSAYFRHFVLWRDPRAMRGLCLRWLMLTVAIYLAADLVTGIHISGPGGALLAAAVLGLLNALLRPLLLLLTLPLNLLTFGLFTIVVNALLLMMASGLAAGFRIDGFGAALLGAVLIGVVSGLLNLLVNERGRMQPLDLRAGRKHWR